MYSTLQQRCTMRNGTRMFSATSTFVKIIHAMYYPHDVGRARFRHFSFSFISQISFLKYPNKLSIFIHFNWIFVVDVRFYIWRLKVAAKATNELLTLFDFIHHYYLHNVALCSASNINRGFLFRGNLLIVQFQQSKSIKRAAFAANWLQMHAVFGDRWMNSNNIL